MDIVEELEKYKDYLTEIKHIDKEIADLKFEEVSVSSSNFSVNADIKSKGYMTSNLEKKVISNVDKIRELEAKKEKIQAHVYYLDSLINTLDDLEKEVIEYIFKKQYGKTEISKKIYRSRANVYVILDRAIDKLNKKVKNRQK